MPFTKLKIYLSFLLLIVWNWNQAQCNLTLTASQTTVPCFGGQVTLTGNGSAQTVSLLNTTFDNGSVGPGWSVSPAGQFNNPCGGSFDGSTHMWMGSTTAAPRTMQTASFDVSCGGQVCFYLKFAVQGNSSPCEGPDLSSEGVYFEYSANGGAWQLINYFTPNVGSGAFTSWAQYCYNIPAAAQTSNTRFRWYQGGSSGSGYDHWGIDNVTVNAINCNTFYYDWAHINGTGDEGASTTVNVTSNSTYTLTYTDGQGNGCSQNITINLDQVVANFTATSVCLNEVTNFIDASTGGGDQLSSWVWNFGDGNTDNVQNPNHTYTTPGNYNVQLDVTTVNNCTGSVTLPYQIMGLPQASAGNDVRLDCATTNGEFIASGGVSYAWITPDGPINTANIPVTHANLVGNYIVTVTGSNGCVSNDTAILIIDTIAPNVDAGIDTLLTCFYPSINLDGSNSDNGNNFTYNWTTNTGIITAGSTTISPTVAKDAIYYLTVTNTNNSCLSIDSVTVGIDTIHPIAIAGQDSIVICYEPIIQLSGAGSSLGNFSYAWSSDTGHIVMDEFTLTPSVDSGGYYVLVVTNNFNGCTSSDSVYIAEDLTALVDILSSSNSIDSLFLTAGDTVFYSWIGDNGTVDWDFGDNNFSTDSMPTHIYNLRGQYFATIELLDDNGCLAYDTVWVNVSGRDIIFPNIFTPNGDGENDIFTFRAERYESLICYIYNRWGQNIYKWETPLGGWDGRTLAGEEAPSGEYLYIMQATDSNGEKTEKTGTIMLKR